MPDQSNKTLRESFKQQISESNIDNPILERIKNTLNTVYLYNGYKIVYFYSPVLGSYIRDIMKNISENKRQSNIKIAGIDINIDETLTIPTDKKPYDKPIEPILDPPILFRTDDNLDLFAVPIYTFQSIAIDPDQIDLININTINKRYQHFSNIPQSGSIIIEYTELMSMSVAKFHQLWLNALQTSINNTYLFPETDNAQLYMYYPPYADLFVVMFTPDLRKTLMIHKFSNVYPTNDIMDIYQGSIAETDLTNIRISYNYSTYRSYIIKDFIDMNQQQTNNTNQNTTNNNQTAVNNNQSDNRVQETRRDPNLDVIWW